MKRKIKRYSVHFIEVYYDGTAADKRRAKALKPRGYRYIAIGGQYDRGVEAHYVLFRRIGKWSDEHSTP